MISVVSFDIFDTLITRKTATPKGIFSIIEYQLMHDDEYKDMPQNIKENFYLIRIETEKHLRKTLIKNEKEEITFNEIYDCISLNEGLSEKQREKIKKLEMKVEKKNLIGINININLVKKYVKEKNVILISDMYMLENTLRNILSGIDPIFEKTCIKIYSSADFGKTKRSGNLYRIIQEKEKISFANWEHIGDDLKSDVIVPHRLGIKSNEFEKFSFDDWESKIIKNKANDPVIQLAMGIVKNMKFLGNLSEFEKIGVSVGGPILYSYVYWILKTALARDIKRLYFIARDGYVLKIIADEIIMKYKYDIETFYIYGSREVWRLKVKGLEYDYSFIFKSEIDTERM